MDQNEEESIYEFVSSGENSCESSTNITQNSSCIPSKAPRNTCKDRIKRKQSSQSSGLLRELRKKSTYSKETKQSNNQTFLSCSCVDSCNSKYSDFCGYSMCDSRKCPDRDKRTNLRRYPRFKASPSNESYCCNTIKPCDRYSFSESCPKAPGISYSNPKDYVQPNQCQCLVSLPPRNNTDGWRSCEACCEITVNKYKRDCGGCPPNCEEGIHTLATHEPCCVQCCYQCEFESDPTRKNSYGRHCSESTCCDDMNTSGRGNNYRVDENCNVETCEVQANYCCDECCTLPREEEDIVQIPTWRWTARLLEGPEEQVELFKQ